MNLPNKLTMLRIYLTIAIIFILLFPFGEIGINLPKLFINEAIVVDIKYFIAGFLFIIASLTDFLDGYIARKYNLITDFGKMIDAIADKVLVNSALIILAAQGVIHPIIPVIIIFRDTAVNSIKMIAGNKGQVVAAINTGKIKTACMMVGLTLAFFYNLPFAFWNLRVADLLLAVATILSIVSGFQYYAINKHLIEIK
ncbi:MAG: CDP-diacylglycerol--glycerol-3-phosphate 3-phosphatidyltransferase [Bacilli bacterium]|nr:CDP-diacylglycerol--glycerol-3-phosphate 3-phosphatidyltransferase [Bacilli bacterium]